MWWMYILLGLLGIIVLQLIIVLVALDFIHHKLRISSSGASQFGIEKLLKEQGKLLERQVDILNDIARLADEPETEKQKRHDNLYSEY